MATDTPRTESKCDGVKKAEYNAVMASLKAVQELCTTDHESKDAFIHRVLLCLPKDKGDS